MHTTNHEQYGLKIVCFNLCTIYLAARALIHRVHIQILLDDYYNDSSLMVRIRDCACYLARVYM